MPCGLGVHPFFIKDKDVCLNFKSQVVWSNEPDPIFDEPYATPTAWNFNGGKPLNNAVFDTCFGGFEEQGGDLLEALLLGLGCKVGILVASHGFAGECGFQVLLGLCACVLVCHWCFLLSVWMIDP